MADAETEPYLYIELDEALALFAEIKGLSMDAARAELRDEGRLESALMRPQHAAHYEGADLAQQAALLLCGIAETPPFVDGNKSRAARRRLT